MPFLTPHFVFRNWRKLSSIFGPQEMEDDVIWDTSCIISPIDGEGVGCKDSQFFMLDIQVVHMTYWKVGASGMLLFPIFS